jgi:outer membrane receptor for ferrienterochelin and colicins
MKRVLLIFCFLFCALHVQSQETTNYTITGKVIDAENGDALEYATITFNPEGSSQIIGAITNHKGNFEISVAKGKYTITVEYLAYKTKIFKSQDIVNNVHYGSIELSEDTELLEDIKIIGEKKTIELKPKKLIYNVTKDVAAQGSMVSDILGNIPSVIVNNGIPNIRGQEATVMINGKTSSLSKTDALKSLPAGAVEKVEVITSPGAQYKSSYKSIINIILKKGVDEGLNASITGSIGYRDLYGGLLTLNHKSKGVNFYTNTSYSHRNTIRLSNAENEYFPGGMTTAFLEEQSEFESNNNSLNTTIGADFDLSKSTVLTTSINYANLNHRSETETNSTIFDPSMSQTSFNKRDNSRDFNDEIVELLAEVNHQFTKEGRSLNAFVRYTNDTEAVLNNISNTDVNYTSEIFSQKNKLTNTEFDINYKSPITKNTFYTIGYNGDFGKIPYRNSTTSRNIDFSRDVHGAFIDVEYESDKLYVGLGLRGEFSEATIDNLNLNSTQINNLNDFFPSGYLQYTINDKKLISLSYSKNIWRAGFERLQPFEEKFSETSSYVGNELLKPVYLDSYSLDYTYSNEKITIIPSLFYNKFNDYWQDVTYETGEEIDGIHKLITTPQNVGHVNYYGIDLTTSYRVNNQLNFTFNSTIYNFDQHGVFETTNTLGQPVTIDYNYKNLNGTLKLLTQLKLAKSLKFQTNIVHKLISKGPISTRKAFTYANFSASKDLFDRKATLSLNVSDVLNSNQTKRDRFDTNYFSESVIKNKNPDIILSFTYRFNQSKSNRKINFDKKDRKPNF